MVLRPGAEDHRRADTGGKARESYAAAQQFAALPDSSREAFSLTSTPWRRFENSAASLTGLST
jgi:hypothetical protein